MKYATKYNTIDLEPKITEVIAKPVGKKEAEQLKFNKELEKARSRHYYIGKQRPQKQKHEPAYTKVSNSIPRGDYKVDKMGRGYLNEWPESDYVYIRARNRKWMDVIDLMNSDSNFNDAIYIGSSIRELTLEEKEYIIKNGML